MATQLLVYDEFVPSGVQVFTPASLNRTLGDFEKIGIHCLVDLQNAAGGIYVQIQHSGDGRNWLPKNAGNGEISTPSNVGATAVASLMGFDQGASPPHANVRLAVTLIAPLTSAHVKIYVTGR